MDLMQELKGLGVNTEEALKRMGGNTALYQRMLVKFNAIIRNSHIQIEAGDDVHSEAFEMAHAIKGAAGNLAITPVYDSYSQIVGLLREEKPEQARKVLEEIIPVQTAIVDCIEKYT